MLYLGVFFELVSMGTIMASGVHVPARGTDLSSQYSSLTLIILGMGFSNVANAFQQALSGIGGADTTTYALVFLGERTPPPTDVSYRHHVQHLEFPLLQLQL